ncbi:MAG: ADP-ribosylation factor-like protein [Candidatus Lokiarchaeia archaeon]
MSESAKNIIRYFCDRFLDIDYYPTDLKTILDLQLNDLKNIKEEELKKFKKLKINTLRDLSRLEKKDIEKLIKKDLIDRPILYNALIAANLINNAWTKRKLYQKKPKMKVVIAGLDFAGKTSLINRLLNDYNYKDIINLYPTTGANVEEYQSDNMDLILWDLGGQKDNIDEYLESPERFFVQLDVLIFVFDSQDNIRYNEALKYLRDIIEILEFLNENPYHLILLNKVDIDIADDPDFQIKIEYLSEKITEFFSKSEKPKKFEIITTSIFNFYSNEPEITKSIKSIFSKQKPHLEEEHSLTDFEIKLQDILDINLKLMDIVVSELSEIKKSIHRITPSNLAQSSYVIPFEEESSDPSIINQKFRDKSKREKKKAMSFETKKKKKYKKGTGPPKRLSTHPHSEFKQEKVETPKGLTKKDLKEVRELLEPISPVGRSLNHHKPEQPSSLPIHPPIAPSNTMRSNNLNISSLKPPPPPPPIVDPNIRSGSNRSQVITELKELFKKRSLIMG